MNDQVWKRQKRISNVAGDAEEHSMIWGMFMAVTMESAVFMGNNFQNHRNSIVNTADLTLEQMFDISSKLVTEQDEISGLQTIGWEKYSWKYLSLIGDERIINLQRTKIYVFSDSVLCLGKIHQNPEPNKALEERIEYYIFSKIQNFDGINGEPTEFEWNIFPEFDTLQLCGKVKDLLSRLGETPANLTGRTVEQKTMKKNVWHTLESYLCMQGIEVPDNGHSLVPVLRKSGTPSKSTVHKESGDNIAEKMLVEFAESGCPIFP